MSLIKKEIIVKKKKKKPLVSTKEERQELLNRLKIFFGEPDNTMKIGIEVEVYLVDKNGKLINNDNLMVEILKKLPEEITRDYYPYQLEVRTNAHTNPEKLISEFNDLLEQSVKVCNSYGVYIFPISTHPQHSMYNGVHFHISYGERKKYYNAFRNSYPFLLTVMDYMRNSPDGCGNMSLRLMNSNHIGLPHFDKKLFEHKGGNSDRYKDISINFSIDNNRHRKKNVETIELRSIDVPSIREYFETFVRITYQIMSHVRKDRNACAVVWRDYFKPAIIKSRESVLYQPRSYNYLFDEFNEKIFLKLCKRFDVDVDKKYNECCPIVIAENLKVVKKDKNRIFSHSRYDYDFKTCLEKGYGIKQVIPTKIEQLKERTNAEIRREVSSTAPDRAENISNREERIDEESNRPMDSFEEMPHPLGVNGTSRSSRPPRYTVGTSYDENESDDNI